MHWVNATEALPITVRLYDTLVLDALETESGVIENPNSLIIMENALAEPSLAAVTADDRFQFMRLGYFCLDAKDSTPEKHVFLTK